MNFQQFCCFDHFNSLLWAYYSFGFSLLLALKLTIRITERGDIIVIKLERGGGWKNFAKLITWSLCDKLYERLLLLRFKMFRDVLFYVFFKF